MQTIDNNNNNNMLNCAEQVQIQKYKTHVSKTPKTAFVQSYSNIQLSSEDGYIKKKRKKKKEKYP